MLQPVTYKYNGTQLKWPHEFPILTGEDKGERNSTKSVLPSVLPSEGLFWGKIEKIVTNIDRRQLVDDLFSPGTEGLVKSTFR